MPKTFTHFHPLGYVLVVMLGAGVAERAGLFGTAMRAGVRNAPVAILTPIVVLIGMQELAADAAYVVLIPLAGIIFHAAGRHPVAGIAAAFAGVSGGFSANLVPGQLDALLFGITEAAVETVFGDFTANIAGNWFFIAAMTFVSCRSSGASPTRSSNRGSAPTIPPWRNARSPTRPGQSGRRRPSPDRSARACAAPVWPCCS